MTIHTLIQHLTELIVVGQKTKKLNCNVGDNAHKNCLIQ